MSYKTDAVIAAIAQDLYKARQKLKAVRKANRAAHRRIISIGGPLNDNRNQYNKAQLQEWQKVLEDLEGGGI